MDQTGPGSNKTISGNGSMTTAAGTPGYTAARVVDDAASRAHQTIDKAAASAPHAVDRLASNAHSVVDKAAVAASDAAEGIESRVDDLQAARARISEQCQDYVQENPLKSVGIAVLVGFVLAKLI